MTATQGSSKWEWSTLGEVSSKPQYGWTTSGAANGKVKLLRTTDITSGEIDWKAVPFCREEPPEYGRYKLNQNDIVVSRAGSVGVSHLLRNPEAAVFASYLIRFRPGDSVIPQFVAYFLQSPEYWSQIRDNTAGIAIPNVNATKLQSIPIPVPPLDEQQRIVAEIEKQFTRLDAGVSSLKRVQTALKRNRASVLKAACEGRLVPTEAELARKENRSYESANALIDRVLIERRRWFDEQQTKSKTKKKYKEPTAPETHNLPRPPDGWTWGTWDQLSNWVTYGFTRPMPHVAEGIPIITAKHVSGARIDFGTADLTTRDAFEKLSEKDRPWPGDILVTKDGTIGRAAVVGNDRAFCINQSVAVVWLRSCPLERKFLLTVIASELTQKPIWAKARGVAIQHLSITDFAKMAVPIPPLAEQKRIVAEVERKLSLVEELEAVVSANLQRATGLRRSILREAFSGDLIPPSERNSARA
jgi:type I restriction enzyme, S subunit